MAIIRLFSLVLRAAELAFAAIVAGVNGSYLHAAKGASSWDLGRFIYTEVVAGIAIFLALIWLIPFSGSLVHWPVDFFISVCWFVAFGLLVNFLDGSCGSIWNWDGIRLRGDDQCAKFKAVIAFAFLSAICWLVSALIGLIWVRDREARAADRHGYYGGTYSRRRFGRRARV